MSVWFLLYSAEGVSWRPLTLQNSTDWHLQTKMPTYKRNDTKKWNSSPHVIIKPYYRYVMFGNILFLHHLLLYEATSHIPYLKNNQCLNKYACRRAFYLLTWSSGGLYTYWLFYPVVKKDIQWVYPTWSC